ncbi:amino acid adenylation domain-containing protein [Actinomycetes bacterium M1A6_2h]
MTSILAPLSSAQSDIWFAQQLEPDIPFTISYYVDLVGTVDHDLLAASASAVLAELGCSAMRVVTVDGLPHVTYAAEAVDVPGVVDCSGARDPESAAADWMSAHSSAPMPVGEPLVRCTIVVLSDTRCYWYTRAHHIALDGYGSMVLLRRLAERYGHALQHRDVHPPRTADVDALRMADNEYRASGRHQRDRDFWATVVADLPPAVTLTSARSGPIVSTVRVGSVLDNDVHHTLSRTGRAASTAVIAAFAAYLARTNDTDDVVLALPVSARTDARLRRAAGTVANVVPLRLTGIGCATVGSAMKSVEAAVVGVLRHQRYRPESGGIAAARYGPVVNVMMFDREVSLGDVTGDVHVLTTGPTTDLALNIYPGAADSALRVDFEANPATYDRADLSAHHRRFLEFLRVWSEEGGDDRAVSDLPLRLLDDQPTPRPGRRVVETRSLTDLLVSSLSSSFDSTAVTDRGSQWTYRQLHERSNCIAATLINDGIEPERSVAVSIPRSYESVLALWAVAKTGATYVPLDPDAPSEREAFVVADSGAVRGLTTRGRSSGRTTLIPWLHIDTVDAGHSSPATPVPVLRDHAAYTIYTSGSTGRPKGVVVTNAGLAGLAEEIRASYGMSSSSRVSHFAAPGFDTALVEVVSAALTGATVVVVPDDVYGGDDLTDLLARERVTHFFATPSALSTVDPARLAELSGLVVGGEVCPPALVDRWAARTTMRNAYGPTETTCSVTLTEPLVPGRPVTIGRPMVGVTALLLDRRLRPVPTGAVGELYIVSPAVARGYLGAAAQTASRFVAAPTSGARMFRTGDRARATAAGVFEFLGRSDDQIKLRGFRIELREIDSALRDAPGVASSATVLDRTSAEPRLASYVVPSGGGVDGALVRKHLARRLPPYMIPASVTVLDALPLTPNRKLDVAALPPPDFQAGRADIVLASTPTQRIISSAFAQVLGSDEVDIRTSFFDLGGDSLAATRVVGRVNADASTAIGVRDIVESPTVSALASLVDAARTTGRSRPVPGSARGRAVVPLSPSQRIIDRSRATDRYNLPFTITVRGSVDRAAVRGALRDVIERHASLRTRHPDGAGQVTSSAPDSVTPASEPFSDTAIRAVLEHRFDVRSELPIATALFDVSDTELVLSCAIHHIAADGWSLGVLARDLAALYLARAAGVEADLPDLPLTYADYSVWRADVGTSGDLAFWRDELAGIPASLTLPTDRPRRADWSGDGARVVSVLDRVTLDAIENIARPLHTGVYTVLRSVLAVLLGKWSGQRTVVIGTPVAGRDDPLLDDVVGNFVNTVALRSELSPAATFAELVEDARRTEARALDHTDLQFDEMVDLVGFACTPSVHPCFQVALSMDRFAPTSIRVGDVEVSVEPRPTDVAHCDIHVHLTEQRRHDGTDDMAVDIVYATDLFDELTMEEFSRQFHELLRAVTIAPRSSIDLLLHNM